MLSIQRETLNEVRTLRLGLSNGAEGAFNPIHKSFRPRFLGISYMMTMLFCSKSFEHTPKCLILEKSPVCRSHTLQQNIKSLTMHSTKPAVVKMEEI